MAKFWNLTPCGDENRVGESILSAAANSWLLRSQLHLTNIKVQSILRCSLHRERHTIQTQFNGT